MENARIDSASPQEIARRDHQTPKENISSFTLSLTDFRRTGADLHRPECVLTTRSGELYVSDERGGVTRIAPDGSMTFYSGKTADAQTLAANGFAMLADGSFLIAPLIGGGVFRLHRNGQAEMFLHEADGKTLCCPNFVLLDDLGRIWICCLTQQLRTKVSCYSRDRRDGYIVLVDKKGARIVADNIGFPNEVRIDPTGQYLYTNETLAARLLRYRIHPDGSLGSPETIVQFDESYLFDGFALDSTGSAWITALVSNRLLHVGTDGEVKLLIEDSDPEQLARLTVMQKTTGVPKSLIYEEHGATLRNPSSLAFGGPDLKTAYIGSLMGSEILSFRTPVAGMKPAHWDFGPFN
jgi:sugar lactone lactonase YvrE